MSRARELEDAVKRMHASASSIRSSIEEMVQILRDSALDDRSAGLRSVWRQVVEELSAAAASASRGLPDH